MAGYVVSIEGIYTGKIYLRSIYGNMRGTTDLSITGFLESDPDYFTNLIENMIGVNYTVYTPDSWLTFFKLKSGAYTELKIDSAVFSTSGAKKVHKIWFRFFDEYGTLIYSPGTYDYSTISVTTDGIIMSAEEAGPGYFLIYYLGECSTVANFPYDSHLVYTAQNLAGINLLYKLSLTNIPFAQFFDGVITFATFPGETSEVGGGSGSFDNTSDKIDFPSVPTLSAVSAGFITLFAPTITQLNSLASYMWSDNFDIDTFKKLFADPMSAIIGVSIVPVSVPVSGSQEVKIGFVGTGVTMNLASTQYVTVDCGSLNPKEFWGSALDYSPYTKFSIYLPYIGTRELNADDIMNKAVHVKYVIDVLSGSCTAMIKCGNSVLYQFSGACATSIPVTSQNWTQLITSCIQLAGAGIAVAASGGSAAGLLPSTASAVLAMKPNIQHSSAVSGSAGMLGIQQPYLIWELPRQSLPSNYNKLEGYPSNISALLSSVSGYTKIEKIHLENIVATDSELKEIDALLKEGVIF